MERGQGPYLWDVDGNQYIDYCMGWGPLIFGHSHPPTEEKLKQVLRHGWCLGTAEKFSLELAELIVSHIPWVEKIRFVNSGTEAVMSAIRLARAVGGRSKIIKFEGCYHGHADHLLIKAGSGLAEMAQPSSAGIPPTIIQDTLVLPLDDATAFETTMNQWGSEVAAVIIEPLPANYGLLPQDYEFLKHIEIKTKQCGALLIFDEVITGFRVAFGGMAEKLNIQPDLVTYGKILGGGLPVGAYAGKKDFMDLVAPSGPVYQAGTLSANPLAMAAGLSTLQELLTQLPFATLQQKTEHFCSELESVHKLKHPEAGFKLQNFGSMFWMSWTQKPVKSVRDFSKEQSNRFGKIFHALLAKGIYLSPSAFEVGFLSTTHSDLVLEATLDAWRGVCG
jgi:glutamate-1-semialdehyde 2,1-aminomutase